MGRRARNLRRTPFFGKCPSLPRLLARDGIHACTMRLLQETPPNLLNMTEHRWEQLLGPCSNAVTPYEGPQRVDWLLEGEFNLSASGSIRQLVSEVLNCRDLKSRFSVPHLLTIMQECRRPLPAKAFNALYRKINGHFKSCYGLDVPQRIPVHVPVPDQQLSFAIKQDLAKMLRAARIPSPLTAWLISCVTLCPQRTPKIAALMRGAHPVQATRVTANTVRTMRGTPFEKGGVVLGTLCKTASQAIRRVLQKESQREIMRHCNCTHVMHLHPELAVPGQQHIVLRSDSKWQDFTGPDLAAAACQNARNSSLPCPEKVDAMISRFDDCLVPIFDAVARNGLPGEPSTTTPTSLSELTYARVHTYIQEHAHRAPQSTVDALDAVNMLLEQQSITGSAWDKRLSAFGGICVAVWDEHMHKGVFCSRQFDIKGVSDSVWECKGMALHLILDSAQHHGILQDAVDIGALSKRLLSPSQRSDIILQKILPPHLQHAAGESARTSASSPSSWVNMVPPMIFALPKWRSDEARNEFAWRNVISFAGHPVKRYAHLISRCLLILMNEMHKLFPFVSMPSMLGVRDMFFSLVDREPGGDVLLFERDIDNCYWEMKKREVVQAISEAAQAVVEGRGVTGKLWFSVAKGGDKARDRVGKATCQFFYTIPLDAVMRYVRWDIRHNVWFCPGPVLMAQGDKGVPIGGFLSAQQMILWAISKERKLFQHDSCMRIMSQVQTQVRRKHGVSMTFKPGPMLTFPRNNVLPKNKQFFATYGMKGWFDQHNKCLGWLTVQGVQFEFLGLGMWDAYPQGRFGHIIMSAPRRERNMLTNYFTALDQRAVMLADTKIPDGCLPSPTHTRTPAHMPAILFARFVDNIYMGVTGMAGRAQELPATLSCLESLFDVLYDVPLKWEKSGDQVDWCEARLVVKPAMALLMKGVADQHPAKVDPAGDFLLWDRWVDAFSPNACSVCKSMVPMLTHKAVVLARTDLNRQTNLASLVRGFHYKVYEKGWWWPPLRSALMSLGKLDLVPNYLMRKWAGEGRAFRMAIGPASAAHFAPALLPS